jgi:thiamine biosynthesis lipoprotein
VRLKDEALSVSAVWGKYFEHKGHVFGHVIDPQTGQPASAAHLAAVALPSATETDALSTALLTLGLDRHGLISGLRPGIRTLVAALTNGQWKAEGKGIVAPEQHAVG